MLRLILLSSSFAHYLSDDNITKYLEATREDVFLAMELSGNSFGDIIEMPVGELSKYLEWKIKFDKEKQKQQNEAMSNMK